MCGVSLYISKKNSYSEELKFSILDTNHRGPDNSDIFEDKKSNYFIGLGHNRLKIIDPFCELSLANWLLLLKNL